jgi:NhaC family Na+:H+ antiporter
LTLVEALLPVVSLIVLISLSFFLFGDEGALGPNQIALVVATMVAAFVGWRRGYTLEALGGAPVESVSSGIGAIFILLAVGSLIGTWAMSGTLVAMVYYGLKLLSPNYFYLTTAVICAVVSMTGGLRAGRARRTGAGLITFASGEGLPSALALLKGVWLALASGYKSTTGYPAIDVRRRGGRRARRVYGLVSGAIAV